MTSPGGSQLLIILPTLVLLFGSQKLPELANALGQSLRALRDGTRTDGTHDHRPDPSR